MKKFKVLSRETLVDSPFCPIEKQIVELPNGEKTEWFVNTNHAAVIVIPFLKSGEVLLQTCYKHGGGEIITEFCAGLIDDGELPLQAAERELREETGYEGKFTQMGEVFANPTGSTMKYFFFIAEDCEKSSEPSFDPAEQIEVFLVENFEKAREILTDPQTKTSSATLAALAFADKYVLSFRT